MGTVVKIRARKENRQEPQPGEHIRMSGYGRTGAILLILFIAVSALFINSPRKQGEPQASSSDLLLTTDTEGDREIARYSDADGTPAFAADKGYASKITTKTDHTKTEIYYDENGEPAMKEAGYCGIRYEYDTEGRVDTIVYLGKDGQPAEKTLFGYAVARRQYDEEGRVVCERYYDNLYQQVCSREYGAEKKISYEGDTEKISHFDLDGRLFRIRAGYAAVARTSTEGHEKGGRIVTEFYYDTNNAPGRLPLGCYGIRKEYDADGRCVRQTYLDQTGSKMACREGYYAKLMTYYPGGSVRTERYFDENDEPCRRSDGQYGTYTDEQGKVFYLDRDGNEYFSFRRLLYNYTFMVIPVALILVLVSSATDRRANRIMLVLYIGCICYLTLINRDNSSLGIHGLFGFFRRTLFNAEARSGVFKNTWLFVPLGAILHRLYPRKRILLVPVALSVVIEAVQLLTRTGVFEVDDIISNSLGGAIGYMAAGVIGEARRILGQSRRKRSRV